jgi:hypothetical protein
LHGSQKKLLSKRFNKGNTLLPFLRPSRARKPERGSGKTVVVRKKQRCRIYSFFRFIGSDLPS